MPCLLAVLLIAAAACGFGHDVEQDGEYALVPTSQVTDSAPYPLDRLLIVEEDVSLGQTRIYLFTGELARAGLGLEDLGRIQLRHGRFQMAFDPPRERIDANDVQTRNRPLRARAGDRTIELKRLDDTGLRASGASRYLAYALSSDYDVAAYFGALDALEAFGIEQRDLEFAPSIGDPGLASSDDGDELAVDYDANADYVVMELIQPIQRRDREDTIQDESETLEALVRISLAPDAEFRAGRTLVTDVAGQGCWSPDQTIQARLTQVGRRYQQQRDRAWASVHLRIDAIEIGVDRWTRLLDAPEPATYCEDFQ